MTIAILLLIAGGGLLLVEAKTLMRGAFNLAALLWISPLIIGLTIVAYRFIAPKMAVSVQSSRVCRLLRGCDATYLILRASSYNSLGAFSQVMLLFVIPLTVW